MVYMKHLIVGHGEVGKSLHQVLGKVLYYDTKGSTWTDEHVDVVHICIPFLDTESFSKEIEKWKKVGDLVIVHSSTAVGTCDALGVVHSPICGVHPDLTKGIQTFVKYFGGKDASKASNIFKKFGIRTQIFEKAKTTEAMKLWSTTQYGFQILLEKEIHAWCEENGVDFEDVYTRQNKDYNEGYTKLNMEHVVRPYLKHYPGKIGGHCVIENSKLLGDTWVANTILKKNEKW